MDFRPRVDLSAVRPMRDGDAAPAMQKGFGLIAAAVHATTLADARAAAKPRTSFEGVG
jgi:hypothetical protein